MTHCPQLCRTSVPSWISAQYILAQLSATQHSLVLNDESH
jgi:hypothetical protein